MGRLVREVTIGVIGVGRIGSRVINLLQPFQPTILANDINPDVHGKEMPCTTWCSVDEILANSDLITVHIPMNEKNSNFSYSCRFFGLACLGRFFENQFHRPERPHHDH